MPAHHGWSVSSPTRPPRRAPLAPAPTRRRTLKLVVDKRGEVARVPRIGRPETPGRDAA